MTTITLEINTTPIEIIEPERISVVEPGSELAPRVTNNDGECIDLWLHGRPALTASAYRADVASFRRVAPLPLRQVALADLQRWAESLTETSPATQRRKLAAVKSLLTFGHRIGYLALDVGRPLRLPKVKDTLSERILDEAEVQRMIALEPSPRNHALLRVLYSCGLRISEVAGLTWQDAKGTRKGGQLTVFGKGGKTRFVLVPLKLWKQLAALRGDAAPDDPIFRSREGGALYRSQVHHIVKAAAARAGVSPKASAHWLRHAHASHALDRGAPVHVVQQSLGHGSLATTTRYTHVRPDDGSSNYLPE
jgi:integrase/recombinase XerD